MVIDTHVHPALFAPICEDREVFKKRCDEMNYHLMSPSGMELLKKQYSLGQISQVFLLPEDCSADTGAAAISNQDIERLVALDPDFYIGFATVDPRQENALTELRRVLTGGRLAGLKLNTAKLRMYPTDPRLIPLYELCRELKKPIIFHAGLCLEKNAFAKYANPMEFEEVAAAYPEVNMCLAHFGWPWVQETSALLIKYPNLYANTAMMSMDGPYQLFQKVFQKDMGETWLEHNLADKVMFGSDSPRIRPVRSKRGMDALPLSKEAREKIYWKNARRFLGMED